MFKISDLTSHFSNKGFLRPAHHLVRITGKTDLPKLSDIEFICEASEIPGMTFQAKKVKPVTYGNSEMRPMDADFPDVSLTFIMDGDATVLQTFTKWMQQIYYFDGKATTSSSYKGMKPFDFRYPSNYEATIDIFNYDVGQQQIIKTTLNKAWPLAVYPIQNDWNETGEYMKLRVNFAYNFWTSNFMDSGSTDSTLATKVKALSNPVNDTNSPKATQSDPIPPSRTSFA